MPQNLSHMEMLFDRFSNQQASPEEVKELFHLISEGRSDRELVKLLEAEMEVSDLVEADDQRRREEVLLKIREVIGVIDGEPAVPAKRRDYRWLAVAAAVALVIFGAGLFYYVKDNSAGFVQTVAYKSDVAPGKQGATLTLASGKKIRLAEVLNGELADEAGVKISKAADGQLVYEMKSTGKDNTKINTLSTNKGETYQLRLPDGSLVWLNAASSLTYAAGLNEGGHRRVKLTGEGYFQVAKDKAHPFVVETAGQQVEVLGTHFNINSYADEPEVRTTLLEGSVKVSVEGGQSKTLKPGEQSQASGGSLKVERIDTELAVAWKNNNFIFEDDDIRFIMRMVERWYNVEVVFQGAVPTKKFWGAVSRFDNISSVLKILEMTGGAHFKVEGRTVYVTQ